MLRQKLYRMLFTIILFIVSASVFYGQQLPSSGTWGNFANVVDAYGEVVLTGDVQMVGVIRIPEGKTLTITCDKNVSIKNTGIARYVEGGIIETTSSGRSRMFTVKGQGAKMIIKAPEGKTITIDGGADFTWNNYNLERGVNSRTFLRLYKMRVNWNWRM